MLSRLKNPKHHNGQVIVLFALLLPVLIGIMGLAIDAGMIFQERRSLQSAADLSALAGASQLPADPGAAESVARSVATENGVPGGAIAAVAGYGGDDSKIEVTIDQTVGLFFMPVLGLDSVNISARAVAEHEVGFGASIFAKKDTHCWDRAIDWSASNVQLAGDAHSNAGLMLTGNDNIITGKLTYKTGNPAYPIDGWTSCLAHVYTTGSNPDVTVDESSWQDYPESYTADDFSCSYSVADGNVNAAGPWWVDGDPTTKRLNPGVICSSTTLTLNDTGVRGTVTFVAPRINITGNNFELEPYADDVLILGTAGGWPSVRLRATGGTWEGMIFTRDGQVELTGYSDFDLRGSIVAWAVSIKGDSWQISGNTGTGINEPMRLVE
ncbi:MAG: pilus assembly protein TadG-related protein [Thermomicrobiales bacterium]